MRLPADKATAYVEVDGRAAPESGCEEEQSPAGGLASECCESSRLTGQDARELGVLLTPSSPEGVPIDGLCCMVGDESPASRSPTTTTCMSTADDVRAPVLLSVLSDEHARPVPP